MFIVLIHAFSLSIKPSVKLNIHNECSNVDFVSLTYATGYGLDCYRLPDYKVRVSDTMRFGFIIKSFSRSYGALICKLQRRQSHNSIKINKDTPNAAHLLVVWEAHEYELRVDALLVEDDKRLDWNTSNLGVLHEKNSNLFRLCSHFGTETWILDDDAALVTAFEIVNEGFLLNMTISEVEKYNCARMPAHVDPER
jgi:hypothetical protein